MIGYDNNMALPTNNAWKHSRGGGTSICRDAEKCRNIGVYVKGNQVRPKGVRFDEQATYNGHMYICNLNLLKLGG